MVKLNLWEVEINQKKGEKVKQNQRFLVNLGGVFGRFIIYILNNELFI